jgi:hypothetical protein
MKINIPIQSSFAPHGCFNPRRRSSIQLPDDSVSGRSCNGALAAASRAGWFSLRWQGSRSS